MPIRGHLSERYDSHKTKAKLVVAASPEWRKRWRRVRASARQRPSPSGHHGAGRNAGAAPVQRRHGLKIHIRHHRRRQPCGQRHRRASRGTRSRLAFNATQGQRVRASSQTRRRPKTPQCATSANASRAAASVASITAASCALDMKPASYADGARYTPRCSIAWKKRLKVVMSQAVACA